MTRRDVTPQAGGALPARRPDEQPLMPWLPTLPFLTLSYTVAELTVEEGRTRLRGVHGRLEDGRLRTERFDATLGPEAFAEATKALQAQVLDCMRLFQAPLRAFFPLLPDLAPPAPSRDESGAPPHDR